MTGSEAAASYDVLVVMDHYLPSRLAGGPVTTVANLTERLGGQLRFLIITRTSDLDGTPYPGIVGGAVRRVANADVLYLDRSEFGPAAFFNLLRQHGIPLLYLNSFFSTTTVRTLWAGGALPPGVKLVLAPRGEFSPGALQLKRLKKRLYLQLFNLTRLDRRVSVFQASSSVEQQHIWRTLGPVPAQIAVDLAAPVPALTLAAERRNIVFLARISPMKNLLYALEVLRQVSTPLRFDIYGPLEDEHYWQKCQAVIRTLPAHIQVQYRGAVQHEEIHKVLSSYAAMLFPTLGENYGHVIWEALASGCPVVTSDQTMWHDLKKAGVGYTLPLSQPEAFVRAVTELVCEGPDQQRDRAARCLAYARAVTEDQEAITENLALLT